MKKHFQYDILIIGAGSAGLTAALHLANHYKVAVLSKTDLQEGSSYYAQGGVASVYRAEDSIQSHIEDTLKVGCGLCDKSIVEAVVREAPSAIEWLIELGLDFTRETLPDGREEYHLTREGGHTHRRVWHSNDATGKALKDVLDDLVKKHPNIELFEQHAAIDLIKQNNRCVGAYVLDCGQNQVHTFQSNYVILATGGGSRVYLYTTNPSVASGDGIAMASRAGCRVANMEFNQFHPTCLFHRDSKPFLISEVLRGEGGVLRLPDGYRFMPDYDERAELSSRDIVARAIDDQMKRHGCEYVFLDITHKSKEFIMKSFPTIYNHCKTLGIDITKDWIPVVPAAHYTCGGVVTDISGKTDVDYLYAVGEVASTGLHGANRMASNSLLECLVFAKHASEAIIAKKAQAAEAIDPIKPWDESQVMPSDEEVMVTHNWEELRRLMWDYVGIVRTTKRLQRAKRRIELLTNEIQEYYAHYKVTRDLIELRNLVLVASLIVEAALQRKESRGLHYTLDYLELSHSG
ncbi:MAG: L-aspartate oxidase [Gammaproteobacteria bacterium]